MTDKKVKDKIQKDARISKTQQIEIINEGKRFLHHTQ